ncbi:MAG: tyrosine--tRNA ligase [Saprospiraceae bacterium]|nr:tyrosine--tRNA ligase [Candidatus Brachybacter algidus]MBK8749434.1 tyrosine--tRNA ligase [Candidatus Brachybacter algidus]
MNFIEELKWRGMLQDSTPGVEDLFKEGPVTGYIGFDPTAASLTIGNFVQVMLLSFFQRTGNKPIVLMGGATGLIGDPSFKDNERVLKTAEEVQINIDKQMLQFRKLLNFDGPNGAVFVNNYDFYKEMNVLTFLRDVGKTLTVNYMSSKESVKKRMETGISFTEFSYQLLQGYDYQVLYDKYGCKIQMGGSDQWGNITAGTEFIRRNVGGKAYAATTPLLTKADGQKFGKSETGNIWLDPEMTNAYQFYQFWLNSNDADVPKLLRYFSYKTKEEIEALDQLLQTDPNEVKRTLAEELTARVHSAEDMDSVKKVSSLLFGKGFDETAVKSLDISTINLLKGELQVVQLPMEKWNSGSLIVDILTEDAKIFASKGDAKRAIHGNALQINRVRISELSSVTSSDQIFANKYVFVENGKKQKVLVELI